MVSGSLVAMVLLWLGALPAAAAQPQGQARSESVRVIGVEVDQVGYLPETTKLATVSMPAGTSAAPAGVAALAAATRFTVRRATNDAAVFEGTLAPAVDEPDSGDRVRIADFSAFREAGTFYIAAPPIGRSPDFTIAAHVYARTWYLAMRAFYGQRCNTAVDLGPEFPGYAHAACHLSGALHASAGPAGAADAASGQIVSPHGGWHDAGDYGRYIVNSGITTGTLLWMWELYGPRLANVKLNIPESNNSTPDVLDEIRWNLEWMLSMQDTDGGVWHKQTSERFPAFIMPEADTLTSYVIGTGATPFKSTCATADLAAVAAIAARVYRPFDAAFATRADRAARAAWRWTEAHPNVTFKNPAGVATGEYGDADCSDERLWAAAELWRTTHETPFQNHVRTQATPARLDKTLTTSHPPSWADVAPLALWTYALAARANASEAGKTNASANANDALAADIERRTVEAARAIVTRTNAHGYRISMLTKDYIWGSNSVAANYGVQLLIANAMQPDAAFVNAARENLHYLLGRNTFSLSWVTQVGAHPYRHPHHRPSGADQNAEPWPGLLSGGPNAGRQDPAMKKLPPDIPPARMYLDEQESYASNEIAINWNAPLVFLLAGIDGPER
jgi:endoglucanase